jgi:Methyltransferase domain
MSAWSRRARTWPRRARSLAETRPRETWRQRGTAYAEGWHAPGGRGVGDADNPLRAFFNARTEGRGIWKWDHYFDAYHRHFARFRGEEVHILEIGIYSGGSLEMWHDYFGPRCHVYGVDVEEACRRYEDEQTTVFIGDQADRAFWRRFRSAVPVLDIVVDDGGHQTDQQANSVEELLPHLRPGGVYVVEDHHGTRNQFAAYMSGLVDAFNAYSGMADHTDPERRKVSAARGFQSAIDSIHTYPFLTVIEKRRDAVGEFVSPMHGTQWEPFLS